MSVSLPHACPCLALDFHLKAAEGERNRDFLLSVFLLSLVNQDSLCVERLTSFNVVKEVNSMVKPCVALCLSAEFPALKRRLSKRLDLGDPHAGSLLITSGEGQHLVPAVVWGS